MSSNLNVAYSEFISESLELQLDETEPYLNFCNVRISPSSMIFKDAFEGKSYFQKVSIQNCGKSAAFIRIGQATSSSFHIKSLIRGRHLPPGLIITRYVKYTYMRATSVPLSWIPIIINNKRLDYKLKVLMSKVSISVIPQQLDFGIIDAGCSTAVRMFSLRNDGSKGTRFAIDLGTNDIQLIVEPYKGIIQPHDVIKFRVECLGTQEGVFRRQFWVKCETPKKINVKVKVITQKLLSFHPDTTADCTIINFGRSYFGCSITKTSVVRNISGSSTVFCVLGDILNKAMSLNEARTCDPSYNNFLITPLEGSWLPNEGEIFHFTYKPIFDESHKIWGRMEKQSSCSIRISRLSCANLSDMHYADDDEKQESHRVKMDDSVSMKSELFAFEDYNETSIEEIPQKFESHYTTTISLPSFVRVFLYGEAEEAKIILRPNSLHLQDVESNLEITRELLITNQSWDLPITIEYKKVCFVKVEPNKKFLRPLEQFEVCVKIITAKLGKVSKKIGFDLLYYNEPREANDCVCVGYAEIPLTFNVVPGPVKIKQKFNTGITPEYIKEVGYNVDDVRYNSAIVSPRATLVDSFRKELCPADDAIIAFPNDRPKNLRPWKSAAPCRTICAGIPRTNDQSRDPLYQLSKSSSNMKHQQYGYYQKYTREEGARLRMLIPVESKASDYDISSRKMLLFNYPISSKCKKIQFLKPIKTHGVIPLTPLQLDKIKVHPASVNVGKVVARSQSNAIITVVNDNDFGIEVLVRSRKPAISIPNGDHKAVKRHSKIEITLIYRSPSALGRAIVSIDFIINSTHTFMVSMTADVFPKFAKCSQTDLTFLSSENSYKFLNVQNVLNVPIEFKWEVPESCFNFFPLHATIPPGCFITTMVQYFPNNRLTSSIAVSLKSENDCQQTVSVVTDVVMPKTDFKVKEVEFTDIPLNILVEKKIVLTNFDGAPVTYSVGNSEPMDGILINPAEGILEGYAEQILVIQVKLTACIEFKCTIEVEIQMMKYIEFVIKGNVIYPSIVFKPDLLHLKKIVADSIDHQKFLIINKSNAKAYVEFNMEDFLEYSIMKHNYINYNSIPITKVELEANETKQLYIFFKPMGAASYSFLLPYVINGLIGPVDVNNPASSKPLFFLEDLIKNYTELEDITLIDLPKKLSTLNIHSSVGGDMLRFSKLNLNFNYFTDVTYISETVIELKIWNASKDNCKFCLRTDELAPPFFLKYCNGNEIQKLQYSIVCTLGPSEWVTLQAEFRPSIPGSYEIKLPIYVKNYLECHVFNYISLIGIYPAPLIYTSDHNICFEPVALNCESEYNLELRCEYHKPNCKITSSCEVCEIVIEISKNLLFLEQTYFKKISVALKFASKIPNSFNSTVKFHCSCDAELEIAVNGCADNSILTTYAFIESYVTFLLSQTTLKGHPKSSIAIDSQNNGILLTNLNGQPEETCRTTTTLLDSNTSFDFSINYNDSTFPLFPEPHNQTDHSKNLCKVLTAVEEWLFNQAFFCKSYFKIPEGMASVPDPIVLDEKSDKNKKKTEEFALLNYVKLLTTLVGPQISNYIPINKIPDDNLQRINYMYNVYSKSKEFLINHGGFLPHVAPEYLLEFNDYVIFFQSVRVLRGDCIKICKNRLLDNYTFFLISKQCWLDVLLQTYKVLVLARIRGPAQFTEVESNETRNSESKLYFNKPSLASQTSVFNKKTSKEQSCLIIYPLKNESKFNIIDDIAFWHELNEIETKNTNIFNQSEVILLFWLEYHFNRTKDILLNNNRFKYQIKDVAKRIVQYFKIDLEDGLLLISITATYCPYLVPYLRDVYLNPTNIEQRFHNATQIVQCWSKLQLTFAITPMEITHPNSIKIMMLVAYLYEVLPYFYPSQNLQLTAPLSGTVTEDILIENVNDFPICYQIIFLNNGADLVSAPFSSLVIAAKQKGKIPVKFYAKFAIHEDIYLILNGETPKYRYAKSIAFSLNVNSDMSHATSTLTVPVQFYKVVDMEFSIKSPYAEPAVYDIFYSYCEPISISTCTLHSSLHDRSVIPKRVLIVQDNLECDEAGVGILNVTFATITCETKTFWVVFRDASVGDFTIKVVNICDTSVPMYEVIDVHVPKGFHKMRCSCKISSETCKRNLAIRIPCFNIFLYNTFIAIMLKLSNAVEAKFWRKHIGSGAGMQMISWLMSLVRTDFTEDISHVLNSYKTFYITSSLNLPATTIIPNVAHPIKHLIPYHVDCNENLPTKAYAAFVSSSSLEHRNYEFHFKEEF